MQKDLGVHKPLMLLIVARGNAGDEDEFSRYDLSAWSQRTDKFLDMGLKCGIDRLTQDIVYVFRPTEKKDAVKRNFDKLGQVSEIMPVVIDFLDELKINITKTELKEWGMKNDSNICNYDKCLLIHWGGGNELSIKTNESLFREAMSKFASFNDTWQGCFMASLSSVRRDIIDVSGGIRIPVGEELRELIKRAKDYTNGEIEKMEDVKVEAFKARYAHDEGKSRNHNGGFIEKCRRLGVIREEA